MAIKVHLEEILKERNMTSKELCGLIGITEANLSILRSGKVMITVCCVILSAFLLGAAGILKMTNETPQESSESDRLIGVLITRFHLTGHYSKGRTISYMLFTAAMTESA